MPGGIISCNEESFPRHGQYLQRFWQSVHGKLITYVSDDLNARFLPLDLRADMSDRILISSADDQYRRNIVPDVYVLKSRQNEGTRASGERASEGGVAVAEPIRVRVGDEPVIETFIEITDITGEKLITAVELLSGSNKIAGRDRDQYLRKRDEYYAAKVNLVEIDLFRGGKRIEDWIDYQMPRDRRSPYVALVHRGDAGPSWDLYPLPLRQRLPAIRIPLRPTDEDIIFDLQPHLDLAYANGRYPIDYSKEIEPPLDPEDAAWANELLRAAGKR